MSCLGMEMASEKLSNLDVILEGCQIKTWLKLKRQNNGWTILESAGDLFTCHLITDLDDINNTVD